MRLRDDREGARWAACLAVSLVAHVGIVAWLPQVHRHRHESEARAPALSVVLPPVPPPAAPALSAAAPGPPPVRTPAPKSVARATVTRPPAATPAARDEAPLRESAPRHAPPGPPDPPSSEPEPVSPAAPQAVDPRADATSTTGPHATPTAEASVVPPTYGAAYLRNPAPRYPAEARREGAQGTVLLRVWVAAGGAATRVEVDRSSGHRSLDDAAVGAVRHWRFVPAQRGGEPVAGVVTVPLVFRLETGE